jgi:putative transposase
VLTDLKNRSVRDVLFLVCDGLIGLPGVGPLTITQTCIIYQIRHMFPTDLPLRFRRDRTGHQKRSTRHRSRHSPHWRTWRRIGEQNTGAMIQLWRHAWNESIPFLDYDVGIRTMICSADTVESLSPHYRKTKIFKHQMNGRA